MRIHVARLTLVVSLGLLLIAIMTQGAYAGAQVQPGPPIPPARYYGTVLLDGRNVPAGTAITAMIGGNVCGTTTSETVDGASIYSITITGDDLLAPQPVCGRDGALVDFQVGNLPANERALWTSGTVNELSLSAVSAAEATATPARRPVAVPEPTTVILFGLGLSGLLAVRARVRKQR